MGLKLYWWKEAKQFAVEFLSSRLGVGLTWFLAGTLIILLLPLFFRISVGLLLIAAVLLGQALALGLFRLARWRRFRLTHLIYSLQRISQPSHSRTVVIRLQELLDIVRKLAEERLGAGQYEAFLLKPMHGEPDLPKGERPKNLTEKERPKTFGQVASTIVFEYADRIQKETRPWPSLRPLILGMEEAIRSEGQMHAVREVLADAFRKTDSWYRRTSVTPPPGSLAQFVDRHSRALQLLVFAAPIVSAIATVAVTILLGRG